MEAFGLSGLGIGLTLLGFGGAIVALYLLKQDQRRVVVPAIALWESLLGKKDTATLWTRLRRVLSLLLALLVVLACVLAVADLRRRLTDQGRTLLILIDRSASMAASDQKPTRLGAARNAASALVRSLAPEDRALVASLDRQVTPLSALTDDRVPLLAGIDAITQSDLASDLEAGARFAVDVLSGQPNAELLIFSDGNVTNVERAQALLKRVPNVRVRYVRLGESARNVAITNFSVRRYPLDKTHHESIVALTNFGPKEEKVELTLESGGAPLHQETLSLAPRQTLTRALTDLAGADSALTARIRPLAGPDVLRSDDRAFATLPPRRRTRVLLVSEANRYLEAALLLDEYLEVDDVAPRAYRSADGYDVVIFDHVLPPVPPKTPALYLGPMPGAGAPPVPIEGEVPRPFFERVEREHPLVRFAALSDVNIARATRVKAGPEDQVVAATSDRVPLILEGTRVGVPFIMLTFDVRESDFPLRPAWPLFLLGAIDRLAEEPSTVLAKSSAGDLFTADVPAGVDRAELVASNGTREEVRVRDGRAHVLSERAGLYELWAGPLRATVAVNVPASLEGNLAPRARLIAEAEPARFEQKRAGIVGERMWPLLALVALVVLALEWLTFHRRWTV